MALMPRSSRSQKVRDDDRKRATKAEEGFALLSVLWLLLLATVLVASIAVWTRQGVQTRALLSRELRATTVIDAAFKSIVFDLITEGRESPWAAQDGPVTRSIDMDGYDVEVTVSADAGKVDINAASDEMIIEVFKIAGLSSAQARQSLFTIRDAQTARPDLPKIASMTEVKTLIAGPPGAFACLEPMITVHTNAVRPRLFAAPAALKENLARGPVRRSVMSITSQRLSAQVFRVQLSVKQRQKSARILLTGDPKQPYWLFDLLEHEQTCNVF